MLVVLVALVGCGGPERAGAGPVVPPVAVYLSAPDQVLPAAIVGVPYEARVEVSGGDPPYSWTVADDGDLPGGLSLAADGTVAGLPTQAGTFEVAFEAADAVGRTKRTFVTIHVVLEPIVVRCGESVSGTFAGSAFGIGGAELDDLDDLAWLAVEVPRDDTTRVELVFDLDESATAYVERPAELLGSWDLEAHYAGHYLNPAYSDMIVPIDAGTDPSLSGYATEAIVPVLLLGQGAGDWRLDVVCTDGPIFTELAKLPIALGAELTWDFGVYGDETGVRIWTDDPLPDWMIWDDTTGSITGTAMERGGWEFTIVAETEDGRRREERAGLGVYDVLPVACGETVPVQVEEGYFDGDHYAYYDPRGYRVFRLPLDGVAPSRVEVTVSGSDGHYLGLAMPEPDGLEFYGGAERTYVSEPSASSALDPRTYPAVGHYVDAGALYVSAGTIATVEPMELSVSCSDEPAPDLAALPVLEPFVPADHALRAIGGTGPYEWAADGLPSGLSFSRAGLLGGFTGAAGTHEVELTVTDALGASGRATYALHVGADAACDGYTRMMCDDLVEGEFTETFFSDDGPASTAVLCTVHPGGNLGLEISSGESELRVDVGDPGRDAGEMFGLYGTYVEYVDRDTSVGIPVDPFSWPDGDDYAGLPLLVGVRAYDPGDWTARLVCQ